ncbi:hypothetical protein U0070_000868 [Myodes glareolus]|uniref:Ribosomal protein L32 n=1 Tax=Myodes glareolus TaxID=447135 RepID=A0AAW0I570_MYOGA
MSKATPGSRRFKLLLVRKLSYFFQFYK